MKKHQLLATIMAGLLLPLGASSAEVICAKPRTLKPVPCVCGKLIDQSGGPLSGAVVKIIKGGAELATAKTGADGSFIFGDLKSGSYELAAQFHGFETFRSPIVVAKPANKCRHGLIIVLVTPYPDNCGSYVEKQ